MVRYNFEFKRWTEGRQLADPVKYTLESLETQDPRTVIQVFTGRPSILRVEE